MNDSDIENVFKLLFYLFSYLNHIRFRKLQYFLIFCFYDSHSHKASFLVPQSLVKLIHCNHCITLSWLKRN